MAETATTTDTDEHAYIYKMSWYESPRHKISHTDMYYLNEEDTRWGHDEGERCEIRVIRVKRDSDDYRMAERNTHTAECGGCQRVAFHALTHRSFGVRCPITRNSGS